ncbi:uncharacterized protein STEHIDRAFT_106338 [Stereum hirsutum FP-91666 SS1]|uniref:Uncharacterized protein n=1 Tax=Stereum hirsutum (strain FP-91666) TaxID=721885 RepID=R7RVW1_STEHR|nr:uncharacterized protein STEHIDRAFT_106338 [Stereum hirsutum FP-91666 SS1]EIM79344.1 hypothetical protein STEHIDRAFT_106338 [Stereum hirsutum FP-91666 SS1]
MTGLSALIVGATGATGRHLLREVLSSPHFTRVGEFGRRVTPLDSPYVPEGAKEKLKQEVVDFEKLDVEKWKEGNWDVVFITMGTSKKKAGSAAAFEKIDREYVVNAAKAARTTSPTQRLVYVSVNVANASSWLLYPRSKGLTEQELVSIGYPDTIIFRPGALTGADRGNESRPLEKISLPLMNLYAHFSDEAQVSVTEVAKAMLIAGHLGGSKLPPSAKAKKEIFEGKEFVGVPNSGAVGLAKEEL